jgi:hypothetical protein
MSKLGDSASLDDLFEELSDFGRGWFDEHKEHGTDDGSDDGRQPNPFQMLIWDAEEEFNPDAFARNNTGALEWVRYRLSNANTPYGIELKKDVLEDLMKKLNGAGSLDEFFNQL